MLLGPFFIVDVHAFPTSFYRFLPMSEFVSCRIGFKVVNDIDIRKDKQNEQETLVLS